MRCWDRGVKYVHRIECITRPIDDDQSAGRYDQLRVHIDRRKPTHSGL
jgi:hypothetical protein